MFFFHGSYGIFWSFRSQTAKIFFFESSPLLREESCRSQRQFISALIPLQSLNGRLVLPHRLPSKTKLPQHGQPYGIILSSLLPQQKLRVQYVILTFKLTVTGHYGDFDNSWNETAPSLSRQQVLCLQKARARHSQEVHKVMMMMMTRWWMPLMHDDDDDDDYDFWRWRWPV